MKIEENRARTASCEELKQKKKGREGVTKSGKGDIQEVAPAIDADKGKEEKQEI